MNNEERKYPLTNMEPLFTCSFISSGKIEMEDGTIVPPLVTDEGVFFCIPNGPTVSLHEIIHYIEMSEYFKEPAIQESSFSRKFRTTLTVTVQRMDEYCNGRVFVYRIVGHGPTYVLESMEEIGIVRTVSVEVLTAVLANLAYIKHSVKDPFELSDCLTKMLSRHYRYQTFSDNIEVIAVHTHGDRVIKTFARGEPFNVLEGLLHYDSTGEFSE